MPPKVPVLILSNFLKIKLQLLEKVHNNKCPNFQGILIKKQIGLIKEAQTELPITDNHISEVEVIPAQKKDIIELELAVKQIKDKVLQAQLQSSMKRKKSKQKVKKAGAKMAKIQAEKEEPKPPV